MYLINEQDHVPVLFKFIHDGLHPLFKLATVLGTGHQSSEIQRNHAFIKQHPGHFTLHDAQRKAFHDGGFTHAGFTDQDRVVLLTARQDL